MNKIFTAHFSPAGSVKKITEKIASKLSYESEVFDLLRKPTHIPKNIFSKDNCLIVGMPVFTGRIPSECVKLLKNFKGNQTPAIPIVVYGNRAYEDALLELSDILENQGFIILGAGAFIGAHSLFPKLAQGRPDSSDMAIIENFALKCKNKLNNFKTDIKYKLNIKGNRPYRAPNNIPQKPSGDAKCIQCGGCSKICPVGAIDQKTPKLTDIHTCISCMACIYKCPTGSRKIHDLNYKECEQSFYDDFKERKEPEIFI